MKSKKGQKINYSFIKIMTGSDLSLRRLALMSCQSKNPGPVVWLTGCVHGDEVGGIAIIQEVFKKLKTYPLLSGSVFALPLMNPVGFEMVSRHLGIVKDDLNRSFPGNPNGSLAERIADKIFTTITATQPNLVLDLHNDWFQSIPYTLIDPCSGLKNKSAYDQAKKIGLRAGFLMIEEGDDPQAKAELKKTLSGSLMERAIPALTLELGSAYVINEPNVTEGVKSILNILRELKMIAKEETEFNYQILSPFKDRVLKYSSQPAPSVAGLIRFLVKPGEIVKPGQALARVYNVFGKLEETLLAQNDGVILGHADSAVSLPGETVIALGI